MTSNLSPSRPKTKPALRLLVWLILSATAWLVGVVGYIEAGKSLLEAMYLGLQLFTLHSPELPTVPWTLHLGRGLTAGLAGYAVFRGAIILFADHFQGLRALAARRHVVLAGLGWKARLFLQAYRAEGRTVVILEKDPANPYLEECRERGAILLLGDATEAEMLRRANVVKADILLCLGYLRICLRCQRKNRRGRGLHLPGR